MKKIIKAQFWVLLAGVLFAWINFTRELVAWLQSRTCPVCTIGANTNPFFTPCFYGAVFFTIAFILSVMLMKKVK
jgi:hypothetical protein